MAEDDVGKLRAQLQREGERARAAREHADARWNRVRTLESRRDRLRATDGLTAARDMVTQAVTAVAAADVPAPEQERLLAGAHRAAAEVLARARAAADALVERVRSEADAVLSQLPAAATEVAAEPEVEVTVVAPEVAEPEVAAPEVAAPEVAAPEAEEPDGPRVIRFDDIRRSDTRAPVRLAPAEPERPRRRWRAVDTHLAGVAVLTVVLALGAWALLDLRTPAHLTESRTGAPTAVGGGTQLHRGSPSPSPTTAAPAATTKATPSASPTAAPKTTPVVACVDTGAGWQQRRVSDALSGLGYPWRALGFTITAQPAREGYLGVIDTKSRQIRLYVRSCAAEPDAVLAGVLVHQLGVAVDARYGDPQRRARYLRLRGLPADTPWLPCPSCDPTASGVYDFAESFVAWQLGAPFRPSSLGPPPTDRQLQAIEPLFRP